MAEIYTIRLGITNSYLIRESGKIMLIDAGQKNKQKKLLRNLASLNISIKDIDLIIITHVHHDHVGTAAWIKEHSGARLMVHSKEADIIEKGICPIPKGSGPVYKAIQWLGETFTNALSYPPVRPDLRVNDILDLKEYGFSASLLPTPGHTEGSVCILLSSGECFTGDSCFNVFPGKDVYPPFVNDPVSLGRTWKMLLGSGANRFYPGHGTSFGKEELEYSYKKHFA